MISISCLMMLNTAYASDSMSCENLQVTIFNSTDKVCALKSYHMDHGYLVTPPPTSLMPNGVSNFFIMESQYFGPQIRLSYQCGEETISFISRQNYCRDATTWKNPEGLGVLLSRSISNAEFEFLNDKRVVATIYGFFGAYSFKHGCQSQ